ncbi:MAG TPA: adenylate/guanylate cyclase domain-containing protein [Gaiellaceae bacterium]|nr:adenylate/guanylate cyclase domain-containing protein [Gaiellaceae bacterium]
MPSLPSGTVTFVFTDIEDSTALLRKLGDGYADTLTEHRRIVREVFGANGVEIDTQGDAFFFAFPRARQAVAAAAEVQRAHAVHDWPHDAAVRVRMGLHTGEPHVADEGYLGLDVVRAARICTAAQGGQVLLSESTRALLGSALPQGVSVFPRGERHLKGIEEPERVFELAIDGVASEQRDGEAEGVATPEPPPPPAPPGPPSTTGEQAIERRFDDLGKRLAAGIEEQVASKLERAFQRLESLPASSAHEDDDVESLAARSAALDEKIQARVDAALRAKGIVADDEQS